MPELDPMTAQRRVRRLRDDAELARGVATTLEELAVDAERRLDPVLARLEPQVWAGEAARRTSTAAHEARLDLRVAAEGLRSVADDLRVTAATLLWRSEQLDASPVVELPR